MSEQAYAVAVGLDYLGTMARLPRRAQSKCSEFTSKFWTLGASRGLNLTPIPGDSGLLFARIDDEYGAIVATDEKTRTALLLRVGRMEELTTWASRRRCAVNARTGAIQVYETGPSSESAPESNAASESDASSVGLFAAASDEDLLAVGVPQDQLALVRSFKTSADFENALESFSQDVAEPLAWLADGDSIEEVVKAYGRIATKPTFETALADPTTQRSFFLPENEDELRRALALPLDAWRVFLHPSQRRVVEATYNGPARVLGGAGTGKTVAALHRAKRLVKALIEEETKSGRVRTDEAILFTTFTKNLAADVEANLRKLCSPDEMKRIKVVNLDAWIAEYLKSRKYASKIVYGADARKLWTDAIAEVRPEGNYTVDFYEDEFARVVAAQDAFEKAQYLKASRVGRGTRLDRRKRLEIWKVFEARQEIMKKRRVRDVLTATYECRQILASDPSRPTYRHAIVDEAQDFNACALRLLRALAPEGAPNDLFIVGDAHQRIYKTTASLAQCGIRVVGRSSKLRVNYRTTEELRRTAFALLKGIPIDNLDSGEENLDDDKCRSLRKGRPPLALLFDTPEQEMDRVREMIAALTDPAKTADPCQTRDVCVVARSKAIVDAWKKRFEDVGVSCCEIARNKADDRSRDGVRLATMHRVKGLEFQHVFITSVNEGVIPRELDSALDSVAREEDLVAERSLLYVALTRATATATVTAYGKPSPFFNEIAEAARTS